MSERDATEEPALRIEYLPLSGIARFDRNPKRHDVDALVRSIRRYGFRDAPIFDGMLGALVAGHGRLNALEAIQGENGEAPPGIKIGKEGEWLVPIQLGIDADSAAEAQAFLLDHNALTVADGDGGVENVLRLYDQDALGVLLGELSEAGHMPVTLNGDDLDALLTASGGVAAENDPTELVDAADKLRKKWKTERGQLWRLGPHRLLCGDATSAEDVTRLLDGAVPHLCVTDPPYGVHYDPNWRNVEAAKGRLVYAPSRVGQVTNDDRANWSAAWELFPGDVIYSWNPAGAESVVHAAALQESGFVIRMQIIWAKSNFPIGRGDYHVQHEPCWYAVRKGRPAKRTSDRTQTTLWEINLDRNVEGGHSTQKPVECMARPIRNHQADEVYDPFVGSGTTLIAAEQLGRRCYGIDIAPQYVAVTLERWSVATGEIPVQEDS